MVIPVTDLTHPGLHPYARLTEAQLRNRLEPDQGIFIAESPKVIRVALDAGYEPISLLTEEKHIAGQAADLVARLGDVPVYTGSRQLLASLTGYELTRGVLCAMHRPLLPSVEQICQGKRRIVLVDNVVNSTNTGAILRAAAALGIDGILFTTTCCDPLNRRSVRVSMGTVFQILWTYFPSWPSPGMEQLHAMGFKTVALALTPTAVPINHPDLLAEEKLVIVLGTEGDGLSRRIIEECDYQAIIPMQRGVDSLNVAAAAAVAFWQLRINQ
ncbi:MAG: RNA methyltransferase [Bacteroidales bacterium]|nr:RNA methyltransferase [Bacteroidales bacterium]